MLSPNVLPPAVVSRPTGKQTPPLKPQESGVSHGIPSSDPDNIVKEEHYTNLLDSGGAKGTTADFWVTFFEIEVWRDGKLILYLLSKTGKQQVWSAMRDSSGQQWGWRMTGDCGKMEYLNTIQSQYGWYTLDHPVNKHKKENDGGWCFGGKNGDNCRDAEYWESVYTDNSQCGGRANPKTCDYAGRCVNVNGIPAYTSN
jgi:hypothetical protein